MNPEGKIQINLAWDGQRIKRAKLVSRTLLPVGALLRGKSVRQAAESIPMLFGVCRNAQGAAATAALTAAQGESVTPADSANPVAQRRERLVLSEALLELMWRFLLDLPVIMDAKADPGLLAQLRRRMAEAASVEPDEAKWQSFVDDLEQAVCHALLGSSAAAWHKMDEQAMDNIENLIRILSAANTTTAKILLECWHGIGRWGGCDIALMPQANRLNVLAELAPCLESDTDFALYPHWRGQLMETGALARMRHHPLLTELLLAEGTSIMARLLARLFEVRDLCTRLRTPPQAATAWVQHATLRSGTGLAWVQTARGLLMHWVTLDAQGMVEDYRIVAPTEWNFHPAGPCIRGLVGRVAASVQQAQRCAELMAFALDPCVTYEVEVEHA
jgi:Ni,Fe-hydrogenase I large subunit